MLQHLKNRVFHKIHNSNLVYNTCWEDPRCDRELLQIGPESSVVMLTSAGCNALDYLLDDPASIDCVDVNPRQNALLQLKTTLFQYCDHSTLYDFFGKGYHSEAKDVFQDVLHSRLEGYARDYWEKHLHFFKGKGLRNTFYWYGSAGSAAFLIKKMIETQPETRHLIQRLFECTDLETQRTLYFRLEPRILNAFTRWLFNRHAFQSMLGVPQAQQNLAKKTFSDGMYGYIKHCFRKVFTEISINDNYFWRVYLLGSYSADCSPNYLKKQYFNLLQERVSRIATHTLTLSQFLQKHPGKYTHFILLDHQDWMAAQNPAALQEEWSLILQNSAPNARILLRSAAFEVDFIPDFVYQKVSFDHALAAKTESYDRVGTYASVMIGALN